MVFPRMSSIRNEEEVEVVVDVEEVCSGDGDDAEEGGFGAPLLALLLWLLCRLWCGWCAGLWLLMAVGERG